VKDELYHYGTKGQKWGKRRYQYDDGTWTEEGKKRRRVGGRKNRVGEWDNDDWKDFWMNVEDTEDISKYGRETGTSLKTASDLLTPKKEKGANIDYGKYKDKLDKMSDDDLRKITNRMNLENQYVRLNSERNRSKGKTMAVNILRGTGVAITTTAALTATITNGIRLYAMLKKRNLVR
jgi:hypothetical protein